MLLGRALGEGAAHGKRGIRGQGTRRRGVAEHVEVSRWNRALMLLESNTGVESAVESEQW